MKLIYGLTLVITTYDTKCQSPALSALHLVSKISNQKDIVTELLGTVGLKLHAPISN
jgi:hypothetical protein